MRKMLSGLSPVLSLILFLMLVQPIQTSAQIAEPEVRGIEDPRSPLDDGLNNTIGVNVMLNNYGFGLGGEYRRVLSPMMEGTLTLRLTGLRDVSEQTFTDFFFGQQVIPNKYRRAFSMPLTAGVRHRLFANTVADNYRFFLNADIGPVLAFTYPYYTDIYGYGYRFNVPELNLVEPVNDIFTGLGEGSWHLGLAGEVRLSLDIGENFSPVTSIQLGYMVYFFNQGIQLMQPNQPIFRDDAGPGDFPFVHTDPDQPVQTMVMEPFFDAQRLFGTPQITFIFGSMW